VELAAALEAFREPTIPMAMWALRWILDHPAVSVVIPGASRAKQVVSNAMASSLLPLSEQTHQDLRAFYRKQVQAHIRGPY
jgi:aryl-alcohol dehydrogenase-like predicted oxidoreductase